MQPHKCTLFLKGVLFLNSGIRKYIPAVLGFAGIILFFRYLLPLLFPFVLGAALAFSAEPLVSFLCRRLRLKRPLATGIGISTAFSFLVLVVMVLGAFALRQIKNLAGFLPELEDSLQLGIDTADRTLRNLTGKVPGELGVVLTRNVEGLISNGDGLISRATAFLLKLASGILSHVPGSALAIATGIISSFMISAKLPAIRKWLGQMLSGEKLAPVVSGAKRLKIALLGWLKAQAKLSAVTFSVMLTGFFLLQIPRAPIWALAVALVDAFPILGTGTVLIPWSILSFLQGDHFLAFGLLGLYAIGALIRSVLEPRFLGKQLGLDPLITLMALYAGYQLWGIGGMILAPMMAVAVSQLLGDQRA